MQTSYLKLHWAILCSVKRVKEIMCIHASIWKTQKAPIGTTAPYIPLALSKLFQYKAILKALPLCELVNINMDLQ